jgi:ribulose-phosphate 3-epimerase
MNPIICPAILAGEPHEFREQMERVAPFAKRIQIDLMDGEFAPTKSLPLDQVWWPHHLTADIHLMYQRPMEHLDMLVKLKPHMVIIHNEVDVHHMHFAAELHKHDIKTGLALLRDTPEEWAEQIMHSFDHLLIFSGDLGRFGGEVDLGLLEKVKKAKAHHPDIEIGWDGGINDQNIKALIDGGVDVLNVGGFIQKAENPQEAYATLEEVIKGLRNRGK